VPRPNRSTHSVPLRVNQSLKFKETGWKGEDWIHLAQDRDQWQAPVNTVRNLREFFTS